jgi:uncharacterized damage-inducible protein DinB
MKASRLFLVAAAIAPMAVAEAQNQPPAGPPPEPIATVFRNRTGQLRRNIAQAFDSIPAAKFSYKPTEKQLTFGYIAQHITEDSYLFCNNFSDRKATRAVSDTATKDTVRATWPKDSLVTKMKAAFQFCDEVMANMTDAQATAMITITQPNGQTVQRARMNSLLGHAIDLADHYSQIANYMRLNGWLPPTALPRPGRGGQ